MNNLHPWPLKKSKSWGPFWSYQLNSSAKIRQENGPNGLYWLCCLAGSSKTAPRILIFLMAMGADYSSELISIETYAPQFIGHNIFFLSSVSSYCVSLAFMKRDNFLGPGHGHQGLMSLHYSFATLPFCDTFQPNLASKHAHTIC